MPTLPWKKPKNPPAATEALVMASRLEVAALRSVPRFFMKSMTAWKQVNGAPGLLGASLVAQPLKKTFWTLSAWESRDALYTYAKTDPHGDMMKGLRPVLHKSTFITWTVPAGELPISWDDARRRLLEHIAAEESH
jgi:heme-degrading monooxygenase HmoA